MLFDYYYQGEPVKGSSDGTAHIVRSVKRIYDVPYSLIQECEDLKALVEKQADNNLTVS